MSLRPPRLRVLPVLLATAALAQAGEADFEAFLQKSIGQRHWYGLYLKGEKAGYALIEILDAKAGEQPAVEFKTRFRVKVTALGKQEDLRITESRVYLRSGPLHRITSRFHTQASDVEVSAVVQGDKLLVTSRMGGLQGTKELPAPKESLRDAFAAERLVGPDAKIGDSASLRQFEPMTLKEFEQILTLKERRQITFNSVPTKVSVLEVKMPAMGVTSEMFVDQEGIPLELTVGQMFTLRLEPEQQAKDIRYSSDLIRMGCVRLDPHPKQVASVRQIRLQVTGIEDPALLVNDERQTWTRQPGGSQVVESKVPPFDPKQAAKLPVDRAKFPEELAPTMFIQSDHEKVKALAAEIVGDEADAYAAATRIGRWLYRNIRKVGTPAMSNALETLEAKAGDCTEHTVLFVALARAAGIPAREVAGVTCIERGEGLYYHAWPEVWVGQWIAVDPTLGQDIADATHIKFAQGGADQLFRIVSLFGRLEAKILDDAPPRE